MSCFVMYSLAQGLKKITSYVTKAKESRKRKFFLFSSLKAWDLFHLLGDPRLFMNLPKNYFSQSNFEDKQDLIRGLGETEIPLLEDTNKILHASGPRGKEKWLHRKLNQTYLQVFKGLLWRRGFAVVPWGRQPWQQQSWEVPLGMSPLGSHH